MTWENFKLLSVFNNHSVKHSAFYKKTLVIFYFSKKPILAKNFRFLKSFKFLIYTYNCISVYNV